jgi:hypothetical protein
MRGNFLLRRKVGRVLMVVAVLALSGWIAHAQSFRQAIREGDPRLGAVISEFLEQIGAAMEVQSRHTSRLLKEPDIVGTAAGVTTDGEPVIKVFTRRSGVGGIPEFLEGFSVVAEETGEFYALSHTSSRSSRIDPKTRFARPVPIGVSTGNIGECSAGTIGMRVKTGNGSVYALSNNHVFALENGAPLGSQIVQPGRYDSNCSSSQSNVIGTLSDYQLINFNCTCTNVSCTCDPNQDNIIDAAVALSSTANLGRSTPSNGYGTPRSAPLPASLNQSVQKYGRTSALTRGSVTGINATVLVTYDSGTARFVNQVIARSSSGAMIQAGDSGSVLVTYPGRNPVALLFAGNSSGSMAIGNPIGPVLARFGVSVDGE